MGSTRTPPAFAKFGAPGIGGAEGLSGENPVAQERSNRRTRLIRAGRIVTLVPVWALSNLELSGYAYLLTILCQSPKFVW